MPYYTYESTEREGVRFEFLQGINDALLTHHPESGEALRLVITGGPAIHTRGLKRSATVNKRSPAATACGCASNAALASAVLSDSGRTPRFGERGGRAPVATGSGAGHGHGHGCGGHNHG